VTASITSACAVDYSYRYLANRDARQGGNWQPVDHTFSSAAGFARPYELIDQLFEDYGIDHPRAVQASSRSGMGRITGTA
jgi:hypothetical protein